jgi:hypothetical protein
VAIFFFFGLAGLIPAVYLSPTTDTGPGRFVLPSGFAGEMLASSSALFAPAMILAGGLVWYAGLLPRGISFSWGRILGALLIGLLAYPVGFVSIMSAVLGLLGAALSGPDTPTVREISSFGHAVGYLTLGGIEFVGGMLTILIVTAAFAIATRSWPRLAFRWIPVLVATTISGSIIAGIIHYRFTLPLLPGSFVFHNFLADPFQVFFGVAWGIPLVVLVGEPLLAALVGHWLYLAAVEWSAESA